MYFQRFLVCCFFGVLIGAGLATKGCNPPKPTETASEPTTTKDSGDTTDTPTSQDAPPVRRRTGPCAPGNLINECTGTGDCTAQRDCDALTGKDIPGVCVAGVCVPKPTNDAKIEKGTIDLSCVETRPELPKGPEKATWWGPVETFGLDSNTTSVTVNAYDYAADPGLENPIATFESVLPTKNSDCATKCAEDRVCYFGQCVRPNSSDGQEIGYFQLKDLPTNKLIVLTTTGPSLVKTVQYNLWIPADKVQKITVDGKEMDVYKERAFAVTTLSRALIPPAASVRLPKETEAVLAGEIQDCQGKQIEGARVSLSLTPLKLTYFNGEGDNPDPDQEWTNKDGIYAALNIKVPDPGDILLRAVVKHNGKNVVAGKFKARLFANGVSIVTTRPWYPGIE